jgi:hypothetical protein
MKKIAGFFSRRIFPMSASPLILTLDQFALYSSASHPITLNGYLDHYKNAEN